MSKQPIEGSLASISLPSGKVSQCLVIKNTRSDGVARSLVRVSGRSETSWLESSILNSGFKVGMHVLAIGTRETQKFGEGVIIQSKRVAGLDLHLTEFPEALEKRWLPWYVLKFIYSVKQKFLNGATKNSDTSERARLRILANLFEYWQQSTGALSNLDIDPLPHQIHLVHHILNSGNYNWLIADDVGLGKTIEAGMLIYALRQRKEARRVLIITPSGLTTQWQEELATKFELQDFKIYGRDFSINKINHWLDHSHDYVIGSMDQFKQKQHLEMLIHAGPWDLVLVDEAHRLSRRQYGRKLDSSDRFDLIKQLRRHNKIENLVLLTATPHQGMQDKFVALLELLRPELRKELNLLDLNRNLLGDMVIRNYKSDVTDKDGNFVFHGKLTRSVEVEVSQDSIDFDKSLQDYLKKGYRAGADLGRKGNAIGFVMTVYRKLSASSVAAIHQSLINRLYRLEKEYRDSVEDDSLHDDFRYQGEIEEAKLSRLATNDEFFSGEKKHLEDLIHRAERLKNNDLKLEAFVNAIISSTQISSPDEKVLIFTEYRATQEYLAEALCERFGYQSVQLINGSMSLDERTASIEAFEDDGQFLISTEAGGEGLNLHRNCHIMINYDLPWNPMRLVQRIGRLYRYGQKKPVVVLNVNSKGTLDENIVSMMYSRLSQVVEDMAHVQGKEFNEAFKDDILGEVADIANLEEVVEKARDHDVIRTQQEVDDALSKARKAASLQRDLFEHAASFDANFFNEQIVVTEMHLMTFIEGMCSELGIELEKNHFKGRVWKLRFPEYLKQGFNVKRSAQAITFDKTIAKSRYDLELINYSSQLFRDLVEVAKSYDFGGHMATAFSKDVIDKKLVFAVMLRWQNDAGRRMKQEFSLAVDNGQHIKHNPESLRSWLLEPSQDGVAPSLDKDYLKYRYERFQAFFSDRLHKNSTSTLVPERIDPIAFVWSGN